MLKSRLIPCIVTKGELVVQSFNFRDYLPIGNVKTAIEFFVNWDVDEIVVLDIDASRENRSPNVELVEWASSECFVPLTVGGGIKSIKNVRDVLKAGADKVCINSVAISNPDFVTEAAEVFGTQCITVSVDVKKTESGYRVYDHIGKSVCAQAPAEFSKQMEALGAGEIFLNSVDRDGSRDGYDLALLNQVSEGLTIPVIACGGVGKFADLSEGITKGGCQAVAAANIFQHSEHSTIAAKSHLLRSGVPVRLSSNVRYEDFSFDVTGRPY
ncbi:MAG: HisA/HisF-related TIM barrel protein [Pseudomonadota bacterium]